MKCSLCSCALSPLTIPLPLLTFKNQSAQFQQCSLRSLFCQFTSRWRWIAAVNNLVLEYCWGICALITHFLYRDGTKPNQGSSSNCFLSNEHGFFHYSIHILLYASSCEQLQTDFQDDFLELGLLSCGPDREKICISSKGPAS